MPWTPSRGLCHYSYQPCTANKQGQRGHIYAAVIPTASPVFQCANAESAACCLGHTAVTHTEQCQDVASWSARWHTVRQHTVLSCNCTLGSQGKCIQRCTSAQHHSSLHAGLSAKRQRCAASTIGPHTYTRAMCQGMSLRQSLAGTHSAVACGLPQTSVPTTAALASIRIKTCKCNQCEHLHPTTHPSTPTISMSSNSHTRSAYH